jgi:Pyocin activator protein PrtN
MTLNTAFLLMAQYNGKVIIPLADVCRDYFSHLTPEKLMRKVMAGQIPLPVVHIERSQKSARGVHLQDLADYLDKRRAEAMKEFAALHG